MAGVEQEEIGAGGGRAEELPAVVARGGGGRGRGMPGRRRSGRRDAGPEEIGAEELAAQEVGAGGCRAEAEELAPAGGVGAVARRRWVAGGEGGQGGGGGQARVGCGCVTGEGEGRWGEGHGRRTDHFDLAVAIQCNFPLLRELPIRGIAKEVLRGL